MDNSSILLVTKSVVDFIVAMDITVIMNSSILMVTKSVVDFNVTMDITIIMNSFSPWLKYKVFMSEYENVFSCKVPLLRETDKVYVSDISLNVHLKS